MGGARAASWVAAGLALGAGAGLFLYWLARGRGRGGHRLRSSRSAGAQRPGYPVQGREQPGGCERGPEPSLPPPRSRSGREHAQTFLPAMG